MDITYEQLMGDALNSLGRSQGDVDRDYSGRLVQSSIATALIAFAQELHKINERAEIEIERQDRLQERKDKTKELGW